MKMAITGVSVPLASWMAAPAFADPGGDRLSGYGHMMWGGGYGMFGGLMMLVFWGAVIALIVLAVRWFGDRKPGGRTEGALDILKERFARGEIDEEEYRKRKAVLDS